MPIEAAVMAAAVAAAGSQRGQRLGSWVEATCLWDCLGLGLRLLQPLLRLLIVLRWVMMMKLASIAWRLLQVPSLCQGLLKVLPWAACFLLSLMPLICKFKRVRL